MGQAREVVDRLTETFFSRDIDAVAELYAPDVVAVVPDEGEIKGRAAIVASMRPFIDGFPDARFEPIAAHESGAVAIDEGYFVGTHTASLTLPSGEAIPATGKRVRVRSIDVAEVKDGKIVAYRLYFDQLDLLTQLGLAPETAG